MIMRRTLVMATLAFGFATPALAQMKEGTYSGTYSAYGTYKVVATIGKDRGFSTVDENGLSVTDGLLDHVTWHCWGISERANDVAGGRGYCVGTDPAGDQVAIDFDNKHPTDQKSWKGSLRFISGTGKFVGVTGEGSNVTHGSDFRPGAEGSYFSYNSMEGHIKLPAAEATGSTTPSK
jgi:hypothetical protein